MTLKAFLKLWQAYEAMPEGQRDAFCKRALRRLQQAKQRAASCANS